MGSDPNLIPSSAIFGNPQPNPFFATGPGAAVGGGQGGGPGIG